MSEPETAQSVDVEDAFTLDETVEQRALPPPPNYRPADPYAAPTSTSFLDRFIMWIEDTPLIAGGVIFAVLLVIHLVVLNVAGVASGVFIGDHLFLLSEAQRAEVLLLAMIAYCAVLPSLLARGCVEALEEVRGSLSMDDRSFGQARATLVDPFAVYRLGFGGFWAIILATVYGELYRRTIPAEAGAWMVVWMYVRLILVFGLTGSLITYVALLHHQFRLITGSYLRIDLFNLAPLEPIARYGRDVSLALMILLALAGPSISQPDAFYPSAAMLAAGIVFAGIAVIVALGGGRRAIRAEKQHATGELHAYARELWRRAYINGHIVEAVAVPAMGAMLNVRNEIKRLGNWPGGWSVFVRFALVALVPIVAWFGGQLWELLLSALPR